jgi:hypothetical protein
MKFIFYLVRSSDYKLLQFIRLYDKILTKNNYFQLYSSIQVFLNTCYTYLICLTFSIDLYVYIFYDFFFLEHFVMIVF